MAELSKSEAEEVFEYHQQVDSWVLDWTMPTDKIPNVTDTSSAVGSLKNRILREGKAARLLEKPVRTLEDADQPLKTGWMLATDRC